MFRKIILAFCATGLALSAGACNAVKGLGNDIESVGEAGDRAIK
jgi:predicted small secreted protein